MTKVPTRAWVVTFAGTTVNLCLGILYAWSVWKGRLIASDGHAPGSPMSGLDEGWTYLTNAQGTWAYSICGLVFAACMIPGGRLQDRFGPRIGTTLSGILLGSGCVLAGLLKSYLGLILGFGLLGGMGMGLGYAAATPAAVRWFGPHQRGLIVGLVVGGFGGAAIYIAPLARHLILTFGLSGSFIGLGLLFGVVIVAAGQLLAWPPQGYVPPQPANLATPARTATLTDWQPKAMLKTWQFYALVFLFICSSQSGLLVIANADPILKETAKNVPFLVTNSWLLASFGGLVNASGRIGTGSYSDVLGRSNAYLVNSLIAACCLFLTPTIMSLGNVWLLFLVVGVAYWQYGGGLALLPSFTADYFGPKNLGYNYGLVFLGWGIAFVVPQLAGYIKDTFKSLDLAFYAAGGLLLAASVVCRFIYRPTEPAKATENVTT